MCACDIWLYCVKLPCCEYFMFNLACVHLTYDCIVWNFPAADSVCIILHVTWVYRLKLPCCKYSYACGFDHPCVCHLSLCMTSNLICTTLSMRVRLNRHYSVWLISRAGQNRIYTPYMTVYLLISLPKIPYTNRIYMVLANPTHF